jgi:Family of unknown function (DUF6252)
MAAQSQTTREYRLRARRENRMSNARFLVTAGAGFAPVLLAIILVLIASACERGPSSPTGPSVVRWCDGLSLGTMQATIDGTTWTPVRVSANSYGSSLELIASDCTYELVVFFGPVTGAGTYTIPGGDISSAATLSIDGRGPEAWTANPTQGGSGSVTLTAFTKPTTLENVNQARASGTFSFTLIRVNTTDTKVITNGSFESGFASFAP